MNGKAIELNITLAYKLFELKTTLTSIYQKTLLYTSFLFKSRTK